MPRIVVKLEGVEETKGYLAHVQRQIPFAAALAINRTAEEGVEVARKEMRRLMTIRREWTVQQLRVLGRATKEDPRADIGTTPRGFFLAKFREGGTATQGINPFAIPTSELRPTPQTVIPQRMYPTALGFALRRDPSGAHILANQATPHARRRHVRQRYFQMRPGGRDRDDPAAGVWARLGSGRGLAPGQKDRIVKLWSFRSLLRVPRLPFFHEPVEPVIQERLPINFRGFLEHAMQTAR